MSIYKLVIQYKGTHFHGFQIQAQERTIQGELNRALQQLSQSAAVKSIGSGRTDAGVHAFGQVVRIDIPVEIPEKSIVRAINSHLPEDIRVMEAQICNEDFHPIFSAKSKEYNYVFTTRELISPFAHELVTSIPYKLDIDTMHKGASLFVGRHDFINFQCTGTEVDSTVREIYSCEILHHNSTELWCSMIEDYFVFKVVGNGFLKQMVRLMMGALWSLGRGKITLQELEDSLVNPLDQRLGATAPPQGLYLIKVHY